MNLFFDSSALVKLFHYEIGTERLQQLLLDTGTSIHVSELARLEFYTALYRRRREKSIGHRGLVATWKNLRPSGPRILLNRLEHSSSRKQSAC